MQKQILHPVPKYPQGSHYNKYLPVLESWEDPHFVTLTIKAIPAIKLPRYCKGLLKVFSQIIEKRRKRSKRGKGPALEGIRSLECNFNPATRTYNPHFHILVRNRAMAETLISEWLARFPKKNANRLAQHCRKVEDKERDLIELVKYGSKIFTGRDLIKKVTKKASPFVYVSALDNILTAMAGRRIFDRFGFNIPHESSHKTQSKIFTEYELWTFLPGCSDWTNSETGETLTGFQVSQELRSILESNLDLTLQ